MKPIAKAILVAAGALALAATSASAEIACNGEGECWHIKGKADYYKPEHGVHIYPDSWKWGEKEHYKWREHEGRGCAAFLRSVTLTPPLVSATRGPSCTPAASWPWVSGGANPLVPLR